MHIKLLYRKVLYVFLSLMIVISSTQSAYAASPAGWTATNTVMDSATATITAIKGSGSSALQSTVKHAPAAVNIGKKILRGGGYLAVAYAVTQIAGDSVDWVLDPANNSVNYKKQVLVNENWRLSIEPRSVVSTPAEACALAAKYHVLSQCKQGTVGGGVEYVYAYNARYDSIAVAHREAANYEEKEVKIPIAQVAEKVRSNAAAGHAPSQELIKTVALDDFNAGVIDAPLNINAVPLADAPPVDPDAPPVDPNAPAPPFDPSSIISAIKSVMAAVVNMAGLLSAKIDALMVEMGLQNAKTTEAITAGTEQIVAANDRTGSQVAAIAAAIADIEGNTLDGKVINDAIDRAIAAGHTDTASIVAAIEAIEGNTLDGQVINDAVDKVIANDNVNAQATNDVVSQSIDDAIEASHVDTAAVTDAIGAQTDAITTTDPTTGEKSLKLPAFCGFAPVVCDYIEWVKGEYQTVSDFVKAEPETMPDDPVVVADDPSGIGGIFQDKANAGYVSFARECPADVLIPVELLGATQTLNISFTPFCTFASLIRPAVILGAWISGLLIISGGRARE